MSTRQLPEGQKLFTLPLDLELLQALRDESYDLSRGGDKVHMTDIAREAITKRLAARLKPAA